MSLGSLFWVSERYEWLNRVLRELSEDLAEHRSAWLVAVPGADAPISSLLPTHLDGSFTPCARRAAGKAEPGQLCNYAFVKRGLMSIF